MSQIPYQKSVFLSDVRKQKSQVWLLLYWKDAVLAVHTGCLVEISEISGSDVHWQCIKLPSCVCQDLYSLLYPHGTGSMLCVASATKTISKCKWVIVISLKIWSGLKSIKFLCNVHHCDPAPAGQTEPATSNINKKVGARVFTSTSSLVLTTAILQHNQPCYLYSQFMHKNMGQHSPTHMQYYTP